jgi:hypothetical protein
MTIIQWLGLMPGRIEPRRARPFLPYAAGIAGFVLAKDQDEPVAAGTNFIATPFMQ